MRRMTPGNRWSRRYALVLAMLVTGCSLFGNTIAGFNQQAYLNATTLKAEALALVAKATEPYADHKEAAEQLLTAVEAAYEYAKGLPQNGLTTQQWEILKASDGNLLGGFFGRWEAAQSGLSPALVDGANGLISDAFDAIIDLESAKLRDE